MRALDVGHPVPHGLVDGVLQGAAPRIHRGHLRSQEAHPDDVQGLPLHVLGPHVDFAGHAHQGSHRRGRHAMLARSRLGDHALLPQATGQQDLPHRVVDLVGAGVTQILPLQKDPGTAQPFAQAAGKVERRGPPHVLTENGGQLLLERRISPGRVVPLRQGLQGGHEGLRDIAPAVWAEVAERVGQCILRIVNRDRRDER